ncbi:MAG: pyridoxamine 5'-phosphate oxidase family protein [Sarcina sp.]
MENLKFRSMRKPKGPLSETETKEILKNSEYGVIAMHGDNDYLHAIPVNYIYMNDKIYFHSATTGYKVDNLEKNNKVSFTVVGYHKIVADKFSSSYKSVIAYGKTFECNDSEKEEILFEFIKKYSPDFKIEGQEYIDRAKNAVKIYKIKIDHLTGKGSKY